MNKSIISKLTFNDLDYNTRIPNGYTDNNIYSKLKWDSNNTPTVINSNNIKVMQIKTNTDRIHITQAFTNSASIIDSEWEVEANIKILTLNSYNGYFGWTNQHGKYLGIYIRNSFKGGLSLISTGGKEVSFNYKFEANKEYNIIVSYIAYNFRLIINGEHIGVIDGKEFIKSLSSTNTLLMMFGSADGSSTDAMTNGLLWNMNVSLGGGVKNENPSNLTKYGTNLLSRLNFDNLAILGTANISVAGLESVMNSAVSWNYDSTKINNYTVNTTFTTNINNNFTANIKFSNNRNRKDVDLITYGNYKVTYNYIPIGEPEPIVVVDSYTKSALDFENGLVDKIPTTVWNKEGSASVTTANKIFGDNSFETKALGDSLYTNSNVITGGATPFTIEGYYLFRPDFNTTSTGTDLSLFSLCNDSGYYQGYFLSKSLMNIGTYRSVQFSKPILDDSFINKRKIKVNEINKITISYDGSALRSFINDELDGIYGTSVGLEKSSQPLRLMSYNFNTSKNTTSGIIDNINIHDGVATKVRDYDPYEEFLIVDLAFDGENNSTKIVDNGSLKSNWIVNGNAKISTDQKFNGFSSFYTPTNTVSGLLTYSDISLGGTQSFTISFDIILESLNSFIIRSTNYIDGYLIYVNNESIIMYSFKSRVTNTFNFNYKLELNTKYNISIVLSDNLLKSYINGILTSTNVYYDMGVYTGVTEVMGTYTDSVNTSLKGYIKNFKIYNGVAVIPESPVGKIQLDFDNNVNDKYGNSTWVNNGVTFDQVNSVKGYCGYFNNSKLESSNFTVNHDIHIIELDFKLISSTTFLDTIYKTKYYAISYNNSTKKMITTYYDVNGNISSTKEFNIDLLINVYYKFKIQRANDLYYIYINDILVNIQYRPYIDSFNKILDSNIKIGNNINDTAPLYAYVDNFKVISDLCEDYNGIKYYHPITGKSILKNVNNSFHYGFEGTPVITPIDSSTRFAMVYDDAPEVKDFIAEVTVYLPSNSSTEYNSFNFSILTFRSNDFERRMVDKLGYSVYIGGNTLHIGKGSNNNVGSWQSLKSITITNYLTQDYYKFKIIVSGNLIEVYINNTFLISVTDNTYNFSSKVGNCVYINTSTPKFSIKHIKLESLEGELLYERNWQTPIINNKPVLFLPFNNDIVNYGVGNDINIITSGTAKYINKNGLNYFNFDGSNYLRITGDILVTKGNDFILEFDLYLPSYNASNHTMLMGSGYTHTVNDGFYMSVSPTNEGEIGNKLVFHTVYSSLQHQLRSKTIFPIGENVNIKIVRENGYIYMYINNMLEGTLYNDYLPMSKNSFYLGTYDNFIKYPFYIRNFKYIIGNSEEINDKRKILSLDFKPNDSSYLFKDNYNKCVIHTVNITQRDYQDSKYCCSFNGTNQYLQLGKNDLFNFGLDDFVIEIKFKVNSLNKTQSLLANAITSVAGRIFICTTSTNQFQFGYGLPSGASNMMLTGGNVVVNTIYNMTITRINNKFTLYVDGVVLGENSTTDEINLNGNNNTWIGNIMNSDFLDGTIYSLKVLRNTTDLTLLDEVASKFEESFTLSNGTDSQTILNDVKKDSHNIRFIKDTDKSKLIIDGEFIEVPSVENTSNELKLFDNYNSDVNDVKLYNTAFVDEDIFLGSKPLDTQFGEIEYYEESMYELEIPEGDYTLSGFIEGYIDREFFIYNTFLNYEIFRGTEYYDINGMNKYSLDDYEINDLVSGEKYKVLTHEMIKGFISGTVNLKNCGVTSNNMEVFCYRSDNYRHIGTYSVDKDGKYVIPNLDVNSRYDIIFRDKTKKIKDQISNYRKPMKY